MVGRSGNASVLIPTPTEVRTRLGIAVLMLIPIVMVVLFLTLPYPAIRWTSIVVHILRCLQCLWLAVPTTNVA